LKYHWAEANYETNFSHGLNVPECSTAFW